MGDININLLKSNENNAIKLKNLLSEHNIEVVDAPITRITHTSATSIDVCLSNIDPQYLKLKTHANTMSDHMGMSCQVTNMNLKNEPPIKMTARSYTTKNLEKKSKLGP